MRGEHDLECGCRCGYCEHRVFEYFCLKCFHSFNECESFYKFEGINLCPICHPKSEM